MTINKPENGLFLGIYETAKDIFLASLKNSLISIGNLFLSDFIS